MPITPGTNCITQAEDKLIDIIANCAAFRTWTGSADVTAAKTRIHLCDLPAPADDRVDEYAQAEWTDLFPLVVISSIPIFTKTAMGNSGGEFDSTRTHALRFEQFADVTKANDEAYRLFGNSVGDIIEDMIELSGTDDYMDILRLTSGQPARGNYPEIQFKGDILSWPWDLEEGVQDAV